MHEYQRLSIACATLITGCSGKPDDPARRADSITGGTLATTEADVVPSASKVTCLVEPHAPRDAAGNAATASLRPTALYRDRAPEGYGAAATASSVVSSRSRSVAIAYPTSLRAGAATE